MKRILFLFFNCALLIVNCEFGFAQKQGNIWYFGDHAGLDFNSGSPVVLNDGQTPLNGGHAEGTSVICDSSGQLLFYTNGRQVWNKNHAVMPNGDTLFSNSSSTQAALIVPQPGSTRYFYVFTVDDFYFDNLQYGFRYSMVDLCLDNGLGDVVANQKNILLLDTVAEKITGVRHANGTDYWIIVHKFFSDAFYAYHLSSAGIAFPVISHIGSVHPTGTQNIAGAIGQLKASPDGTKLAIVNGNSNHSIAEYFDFDKSTGVISNMVDIQTNLLYNYYGCSFSPDNTKLYISCDLNGNGIYQFDLTAGGGIPAFVVASRKKIADTYNFFGLQLATDGKIYCARSPIAFNPYLDVINNPNDTGISCNYVPAQVNLNGHTPSYGMPNFIDSYDYSNTTNSCLLQPAFLALPYNLCPGTCTDFTNLSQNAVSYQWSFPGASPASSTDVNPQNICYANPGNFDVQLIATNASGSDTLLLSNYITVYPSPAPQSITQSGDTLFAIAGAVSYQWYFNGNLIPGATDYFYIASASGDYNVIATDGNGCEVEAAIFSVAASIEFQTYDRTIEIFPVPVIGELKIKNAKLEIGTALTVSVYNVLGEKLITAWLRANSPRSAEALREGEQWPEAALDVSRLPSGLYYLEISTVSKTYRTKFIKQ